MSDPDSSTVLVIGLGNTYRRDDGVGRVVAGKLRELIGDQAKVIVETGEGASLMEVWKGTSFVVLVDAVQSGAEAGTVFRLDAIAQEIPSRFFHYSTHAFSLAEAVELARAMDELPPRLVLFGIEGADFSAGETLTPKVSAAVSEVVKRVREEVENYLCTKTTTGERKSDA